MKRSRDEPELQRVFEPEDLPLVKALLPELEADRLATLGRLAALTRAWNDRVNLISRKDADHIEEHHILMSLLIAKLWSPADGAACLDLGTGGGFPGIPLAIIFPRVHFTLLDSIAKKGRAVAEVVSALKLPNVKVVTMRAEKVPPGQFDMIIGRAVTALPEFLRWAGPLIRISTTAGSPSNGVIYFKGTRWQEELEGSACQPTAVHDLNVMFPRPHFEGKFLLHFAAPIVIEDHIRKSTNVNMHAPKEGAKKQPREEQSHPHKRSHNFQPRQRK